MNPQDQTPQSEESLAELDTDTSPSVDDFIKELEAKEKALHITADLEIEVSDPDFDEAPNFTNEELPRVHTSHRPAAETNGAGPGLKTRVYELEKELAALKDKNVMLRADRDDIQEKSDRRLKDFESYKYRMDRERRGSFIDQISNLASKMLPVLDNLDRALDSIENTDADRGAEFQQFYDGIILVNQQVNEVFSEMGVQPIATVGELFDPNFHEAVATEERDDMPVNTVSGELLRGYRIGNRVIRHSMVKVTIRTAPAKQVETADEDPDNTERTTSLPSESGAVDLDPPVEVTE